MRIAVIPARGGSKRIPKKNILDFQGEPMIVRTIKAIRRTALFDIIHVSTDDYEIAEIARHAGADVRFLRTPELSGDLAPVLPVLRWTLEKFLAEGLSFQTALMAMPCAPLLTAGDYEGACLKFESNGRRAPLLSVCRFPSPPEWAFRATRNGTVVADPAQLLIRSQDIDPSFYDCGLFSFFDAQGLLTESQSVASEFLPYEIDRLRAIDIDEPVDVEVAATLFRLLRNGA